VNSYKFLTEFYPTYKNYGDLIVFTPYYATWPISRSTTNFSISTNKNCIYGGRYCAQDPDGKGPLTGRDVLQEDLRQICIRKHYSKQWWTYITQFSQNNECVNLTKSCVDTATQAANIDPEVIGTCYNESFVGEENDNHYLKENLLFRQQQSKMDLTGVRVWPAAVINGMIYKGNLQPVDYVFHTICEGYNQKPDICVNGQSSAASSGNVGIIIFIVILVILLMIVGFFFYRRMVRREFQKEMTLHIDQMVSQYFALGDNKIAHNQNPMKEQLMTGPRSDTYSLTSANTTRGADLELSGK